MEKLLSFSAALNEMLVHGAKIQRAEWADDQYFYVKDGSLWYSQLPEYPLSSFEVQNVLAQDWRIVGEKLQSTFIPA